jgi:S-adenosylmethionine hydrolase
MIVTLLSDFGLKDSYVAEVKAVLLSGVPDARLVDITHELAPGSVAGAQYLLARSWGRFPAGTTHLVVVDPGVGTARRALAASRSGHHFVGPDNGVLSAILAGADVVTLPVPPGAAPTFHGRDVFAPAAASLAAGKPLAGLGLPCAGPVIQPLPQPRRDGLISNIGAELLDGAGTVRVGNPNVGAVRTTFGDVRSGELVAYRGSGGTLEVAVRDGSAAEVLQAGLGTEIRVTTS